MLDSTGRGEGSLRAAGTTVSAALAAALIAAPATGLACSICRCGDPTFNALGKDGFAAQGWRLALDWERFDKEQGDPAIASEAQVENRLTALVSYGLGEKLTLFGRLPYSIRRLDLTGPEPPEQIHTDGWSDPELYAQARLWASRLSGGLGRRASLSLNAGVKTPWGENELKQDGARVDEHAQPGTGSTDLLANLAFLYLLDARSAVFVSTGYRHTGANQHGYRYGRSLLATAAYEHKLGKRLDAVAELDFRHAGKDLIDASGTLDEDTGGSLLYLTPRLLVDLGHGAVLRFAAQVPVARALNGHQQEHAVLNVGLTYLFAR